MNTPSLDLARPELAARKHADGLCVVVGCRNDHAPQRRLCRTCQDVLWRAKYPELHLFKNLKASAKRRGLSFTITFEWWYRFCELTGFAEMVGRTKGCASIDRREPWRGYEPDNLQILECGANSSKGQSVPPINSEEIGEPF